MYNLPVILQYLWALFWSKFLGPYQTDEEKIQTTLRELLLELVRLKEIDIGDASPEGDSIAKEHFKHLVELQLQSHRTCHLLCEKLYKLLDEEVIPTTGGCRLDTWLLCHFKENPEDLPTQRMVKVAKDHWQPEFHHAATV